jgi:hypothetical protein
MNETKENNPEPQVVAVLAPHVLARLESKLPGIMVPRSDLEAGYLLGVQAVLKLLRNGV